MKLNNLFQKIKPYLGRFWKGLDLYDKDFLLLMICMKVFSLPSWMMVVYPSSIFLFVLVYTLFPKYVNID